MRRGLPPPASWRLSSKHAHAGLDPETQWGERLIAATLDDTARRNERVTRQRLYAVLDDLRYTTPVRHKITLEDLHEDDLDEAA